MVAHTHVEPHFKATETVRDIIIGMSDGLTVPFALAAGLSGAVDHSSIIVIAGLAEIVAGSISMGLGGYLAAQSEADHYYTELAREYREVKESPDIEREEVADSLREYGLGDAEIEPILKSFEGNHDMWVKFMMRNELQLEEPRPKRALWSALTIAGSYIVGGALPLAPYFFFVDPHRALLVSVIVTALALLAFGYGKSRFVGVDPWKGALRTVIVGGIAAAAAFYIAKVIA